MKHNHTLARTFDLCATHADRHAWLLAQGFADAAQVLRYPGFAPQVNYGMWTQHQQARSVVGNPGTVDDQHAP